MFWLYTKIYGSPWSFCQEFNTVSQAVSYAEQLLWQNKINEYSIQTH